MLSSLPLKLILIYVIETFSSYLIVSFCEIAMKYVHFLAVADRTRGVAMIKYKTGHKTRVCQWLALDHILTSIYI